MCHHAWRASLHDAWLTCATTADAAPAAASAATHRCATVAATTAAAAAAAADAATAIHHHATAAAAASQNGRFEIRDRAKDIIITGGENVCSVEVEAALHTHPAVDGVACVAVPDDYWGEAVCAVVELRPGRENQVRLRLLLLLLDQVSR
jgi:acyl-CoA synthetase (AMP-forming)/AMP-acid ligase II